MIRCEHDLWPTSAREPDRERISNIGRLTDRDFGWAIVPRFRRFYNSLSVLY